MSMSTLTLSEIADRLNGELVHNDHAELCINGVNALDKATSTQLSFYREKKFLSQLRDTQAGAVLVPKDFEITQELSHIAFIRVANPVLAFAKLATALVAKTGPAAGISPLATVPPSSTIHPTATIYPNVWIGENVHIGARSVLYPGVFVGDKTTIGEDCLFYPNVAVMDGSDIGDRVIIHPGSVIGGDGFGYTPDESTGRPFKIPQLGRVRLESDVEVGSNTTIDRATMDWTVIRRGTKIDNLVQIGHNCLIGENTIICSQVGISGSTTVGNRVVMAGQVGTYSHVNIGDNVTVTARGGISKDIAPNQTVKGYPAIPINEYLNIQACLQKLPELRDKVLQLEKDLALLKNGKTSEKTSETNKSRNDEVSH